MTACSSSTGSAGSTTTASTVSTSPSATSAAVSGSASAAVTAGYPVTIDHIFGSTTIATQPQRVVTVGFNEQDFALALGVVPVGTREFIGNDFARRPWAQEALGGATIPTVGEQQLNLEQIAAADPDLILGPYAFLDQNIYDQLSAIAPTVGDLAPAGAVSWQQELAAVGTALDKSAQAQELAASVEQRFTDAKTAHPEFAGKTLALVLLLDSGYYVLEPTDPRMRFFTDLGFSAPSVTGQIAAENTADLNADVVAVLGAAQAEFTADPLVQNLPAVTENRVVYFGPFTGDFAGALGFSSPLSLPYALDVAVPRLAAAADGDPATVPDAV
ncbi:iron-siderophore ABC transporter substrate-binding protein [Nakamurella flava]|uniref:Iron-siderophore ABC transporter substrate-binding protein n=1 Tax=Nakamurella flava TaxID=2576308 RepID=A0A4U6QG47_9ACTN|nr:iron-siderophore ABC transporter substrate-binding protein [Nakamurella flava]